MLSIIDERFTITSLLGFAQGSGSGVFGVKDGAKYHTFHVTGCYRLVLGIWSYREDGWLESSMICTISEDYLIKVLNAKIHKLKSSSKVNAISSKLQLWPCASTIIFLLVCEIELYNAACSFRDLSQ